MKPTPLKPKPPKPTPSAQGILPASSRTKVGASRGRKSAVIPRLDCAGLSDRGKVRVNNEDNWLADPQMGLFIVADGMGGQSAGELASKIVVEVLPLLIQQRMEHIKDLASPLVARELQAAFCELSAQLRGKTEGQPGLAGMGAAVVLALVRQSTVFIGHMGDSRAYLLRHGQLKCLTKDHSVIQLLIDNSEITPAQAATHPARGRLTRYVGMAGEPLPEVQTLELHADDRLLLCTDGLTGMVPDAQLRSVLGRKSRIEVTCERLVDAANAAGGRDNITALLIQLAGSPRA